jgi:hypothetical protein
MATIVITLQDIPPSQLIYNERETKQILSFFWPEYALRIRQLAITDAVRSFAQALLIVAIDSSNSMGYVKDIFDVISRAITRPDTNVEGLAKKLAMNFTNHWWKYTRSQDLQKVKIFETVRVQIARSHRTRLAEFLEGIARATGRTTVVLTGISARSA